MRTRDESERVLFLYSSIDSLTERADSLEKGSIQLIDSRVAGILSDKTRREILALAIHDLRSRVALYRMDLIELGYDPESQTTNKKNLWI